MATAKQQVQKITVAQAFARWMKGSGRRELAQATGLGRGALRKAFCKLSKKTWAQLNTESGRGAKTSARKQPSKAGAK